MLLSFSFNGIKKPYLYCERGKTRQVYNTRRNLLFIPGMPGAYLESTDTNIKIINQPIFIEAADKFDLKKLEEDLAAWLLTDDPVELIFDDEPDRVYFAVVDGSLDLEEIVNFGRGTITFVCPDPYKYGEELKAAFPSDVVTLSNNGTAEADPIFELEVQEPVTFAMIQNQNNEYMMIGKPAPIEVTPKEEYTLLLNDEMNTLTGWSEATTVTDGYGRGTIETDGSSFRPSTFGDAVAPEKWQGPGIVKSLTEETQDFEMNCIIGNYNTRWETGMIEVYLLDALDRQVARIHMSDSWSGTERIDGRVQLGYDEYQRFPFITSAPGNIQNWNNFYGVMKLQRRGARWWFYFAKIVDGKRKYIQEKHYIPPVDGIFQEKIAKVQIMFRKWPNTAATRMNIYHLNFWKINSMLDDDVPIIANAGDIITFDHATKEILINGEDRTDLKDFGAQYFKLLKGENQLVVMPSSSFNTSVKYRERYK